MVAPGTRIDRELAERVAAYASDYFLDRAPEIVFQPQCFQSAGHFAGADDARAAAFVEFANDPAFDAIWFARGGYGACRMAEAALERLTPAAAAKTYLGYSDAVAGYLFMLVGVAGLIGGMLWGSISDRFGRERTLALTLLLAGLAGLLFGIRPLLPALIVSAILFGSTGPAFPGLMEVVPKGLKGMPGINPRVEL